MEFLKKLFGRGTRKAQPEGPRGIGPSQSQAEQDTTRARMEQEMTGQRERRAAADHTEPTHEENGTQTSKE
jgi:hypothetical protein